MGKVATFKAPSRLGLKGRSRGTAMGLHVGPEPALMVVRRTTKLDWLRPFGAYLRRLRVERGLTLQNVEVLSAALPEPISKSYLSRVEGGTIILSLPKVIQLGRIYRISSSRLAEWLDFCLQAAFLPPDLHDWDQHQLDAEAARLIQAGRHLAALPLCAVLLDRIGSSLKDPGTQRLWLGARLQAIDCLIHLGRYEVAVSESDELLKHPCLDKESRLFCLWAMAMCFAHTARFASALALVNRAEEEAKAHDVPPRWTAYLLGVRGGIEVLMGQPMVGAERLSNALERFEMLDMAFESCRTRCNLAQALMDAGKMRTARDLLVHSVRDAKARGLPRQEAIAESHLGLLDFKEGRLEHAEEHLVRSNLLATQSWLNQNIGYLQRQIDMWTADWRVNPTETLADFINERLQDHLDVTGAFSEIAATRLRRNEVHGCGPQGVCMNVVWCCVEVCDPNGCSEDCDVCDCHPGCAGCCGYGLATPSPGVPGNYLDLTVKKH